MAAYIQLRRDLENGTSDAGSLQAKRLERARQHDEQTAWAAMAA